MTTQKVPFFMGSEKIQAKSAAISGSFVISMYLLASWGLAKVTESGMNGFWIALGFLITAKIFVTVIDTLGGIVAWRSYGRRTTVDKILQWLQINNFPRRYYAHDDFTNYLGRIEDDVTLSSSLRRSAKEMYSYLGFVEDFGILAGVRMHSATEIALEMYSPRAKAPEFVSA